MVDYKSIGRRIANNRKIAGMTQSYLSELLDVSESYVSQVECGNAKVSLPRLYQIADVLRVDIAVLVSDGSKLATFEHHSEIEQLIRDWSKDQRSLLIDLILCADKKMKSN